jgi:cytochrome c
MGKKNSNLIGCFLFAAFYLIGCNVPDQRNTRKKDDYIRPIQGINEPIQAEVAEKGEVLISYSDCYTCHKKDEKSVGPAFTDITKRYPANKVYINMLAQKVIIGGSGSWGTPVMTPHPNVSVEEAKMMVSFILSLKQ